MKKYLSYLLCFSLILIALTGCDNQNSEADLDSKVADYLAQYDQLLNEDHNIVYVRNLLQEAHNEVDSEEINQLFDDFQSGMIKDTTGKLLYTHNIDALRKYSPYDQYLGYYDDSTLTAQMSIKYPSQLTLENVLGEECPTLVEYDEEGNITKLYVDNSLYNWAGILEKGIIAYELDDENQIAIAENASLTYDETGLIHQLTFGDESQKYIYDIYYDELNRIDHVDETLSWRNATETIYEYIYKSDDFKEYPDEMVMHGNEYVIAENGKIKSQKGNLNLNVEYNENDQLDVLTIMFNQDGNDITYTYNYLYDEYGLLVERQFEEKNGAESEDLKSSSVKYEYADDNLTVKTISEDETTSQTISFDHNYQIVK